MILKQADLRSFKSAFSIQQLFLAKETLNPKNYFI